MTRPIAPGNPPDKSVGALFCGLLSVIAFAIAGLIVTSTAQYERWTAIVPAVLALLFSWLARRSWTNAPEGGAEIAFTGKGFRVAYADAEKGPSPVLVEWSEVRQIRYLANFYAKELSFLLTHEAALNRGLVLDTTRKNASDRLVNRRLRFFTELFEIPGDAIVARMAEVAQLDGFEIVRVKERWGLTIWTIRRA